MLALGATTTDRITLASGVAAALTRSPFEAACAIADVDEISGGRAVLGIGTGTPEYLRTGEAEDFGGEHWTLRPLRGDPYGRRPHMPREQVPIYLACEVICSAGDDRDVAIDRDRRQIGFSLMHPCGGRTHRLVGPDVRGPTPSSVDRSCYLPFTCVPIS